MGLTKLRLFVSAVKPVDEGKGAFAVPLLTASWTTISEAGPKVA
jgi:hypothetical protein